MNRNFVSHPGARARYRGFSLIELMITIVLAAILLAIAIPSFRNLIISSELTTATNEWVAAVNVARSEAIKRGAPTVVCGEAGNEIGGNDLSQNCVATLGEVRARPANDATARVVVRGALSDDITDRISVDDTQSIRFGGDGIGRSPTGTGVYSGLVADIGSSELDSNNHRCVCLTTGTTLTTHTVTGACADASPDPCDQ